MVDIALPTFPDEQALFRDETPDETAERIEKSGVGEIVVKNGEEPATILHYGDRQIAGELVTPVDTTGAGDSFNGAYLAARLLGDTPADAVRARIRSRRRSSRCAVRWRR